MTALLSIFHYLLAVLLYSPNLDCMPAPTYNLNEPDQTFILDNDLDEISGLSYANGKLYAVQDEKGVVFTLNPSTGKIMLEQKFKGKGDYEAIEVAGNYVFMLKSNGNLYMSPLDDISEESNKKFDLGFDDDWNFEGMGYNPATKELLLCAKRKASSAEKEIFSVPVDDPSAIGQADYIVRQGELKKELGKNKKKWSQKVAHDIGTVNYSFNPSGIAVNPACSLNLESIAEPLKDSGRLIVALS